MSFPRGIASAGALIGLLAGCASQTPAADTPQAQCARQVAQDPEVKAAEERQLTLTLIHGPISRQALDSLRQKKRDSCLLLRGVSPPGGVEKVQG